MAAMSAAQQQHCSSSKGTAAALGQSGVSASVTVYHDVCYQLFVLESLHAYGITALFILFRVFLIKTFNTFTFYNPGYIFFERFLDIFSGKVKIVKIL